MYVVVFKGTRNALLRAGRRNWQTRADMLDRVAVDGIVAETREDAIAQTVQFSPGSSGIVAVPYDEWVEEFTPKR